MSVRSSPRGGSSGSGHPNSDDFSSKSNTLPEVKAIQSKRLYRVVKEAISKLEQNNQHRRNLLSLFQPEQTRLRFKLRDACEKLLFVYPTDLSKKAEEIMWKIVFYEVITAVKNGRKFISNAPGVLQQRDLVPYFKQFLDSAIGFYQHLLLKIQDICPGLIELDYPLVMRPFSNTRHSHRSSKDSDQKEVEEWAKMISYRLLTCLGDLSRYQMEFGGKECRARRYYQLALLAQPKAGMPYNQIATVVGNNKWWGLTAAYYYCCALQAKNKYEGAEANFQLLFDRNKRTFYRLTNNDALESVVTTQLHKSHHTRIFVISFLYLCDLLKPKTYSTDSEITGLCKRLVDALPVCLANLRRCNRESNELDSSTLEDDSSNHDGSSSMKFPDSNREDAARNYEATLNQQKEKIEQQPSILTDEVIFHICVMCLVNVHDLRVCRSNRSSAAIVFTLGLFSNLLEHCIRLCHLKDDNDDHTNNNDGKNNTTKVGDEINFADGDCKCQQQQTRRQLIDAKQQQRQSATATSQSHKKRDHHQQQHRSRRRRRPNPGGGSEDAADLSEGEELGAGDVADSDTDDSDDDDTDRVSFSSGDQLSQDETLTSQDEDDNADDVITKDVRNKPVVDRLPPPPSASNVVVGSLQNTDKKPSQPSPRRQIVLAPSFLRPMSTTLPSKPTAAAVESRKNPTTTPVVSEKKATTASTTCKHAHNAKDKEETKEKGGCGKKKTSFTQFTQLLGRNYLTASIKLLADWLSVNETVARAGNPRALWYRLSTLVNMLPDEHQLNKQVKESGSSNLKKQLNQVTAAAASTEQLQQSMQLVVDSQQTERDETEKSSTTKNDKVQQHRWKQLSYLPEDLLLQYMSMVEEANIFSQLSNLPRTNPPHNTEQPDYDQLAIRICRLRGLCRQYSTVDDIDIKITTTGPHGREKFESPQDNVIDTEEELNAIESMRKKRMMKDMAASRLRTEVAALESSLISEQQRDSALCLFLVPDVSSLCHDLTTIRRLASCGRYIVIISKTVIDGLDAIKKDSQGARDAIRYLEMEFKKRSRFVRPQHSNEVVVGVDGEPTKLRNQDVRVWRLYRIIECCRYLMKREAKKQGLDVKEQEGLVTVLMHELTGSTGTSKLFERAILSANNFGIQVSKASVFERSRTRRTS